MKQMGSQVEIIRRGVQVDINDREASGSDQHVTGDSFGSRQPDPMIKHHASFFRFFEGLHVKKFPS